MAIIGIDIGNYITKTSDYFQFLSKCSTLENRYQKVTTITRAGRTVYMEEGSWDTTYRKVDKENYMDLLLNAITGSSFGEEHQIVVGLPLSQYKSDKEELKQLIMDNRFNYFELNGDERRVIISDCEVVAEGVGAIAYQDYQGIILDIGGRTTDIAMIEYVAGRKKVVNPFSMSLGTLNLYTDFIKTINARYGLDLELQDGDRILRAGLQIDGEKKDIDFAMEVFKVYVDEILKTLQLEYSVRTNNILAIGGGADLLFKPLKKRIPQLELHDNSLFANALGYKRVGDMLWL